MALAADLGLDEKRLRRRIGFLKSRAEAHLTHEDPRREISVACAGSLLRDAAASAMLVERYSQARDLLARAGNNWAEIGLFAGYALLAIGQRPAWWSDWRPQLLDIDEHLAAGAQPEGEGFSMSRRKRAPMTPNSIDSSRQLLHLYQSMRPRAEEDEIASNISWKTRNRLVESSTTRVGMTEIPLQSYLRLFDASVTGDFDRPTRDTLAGLVLRRVEQLEAAKADEYHWRMGLAPTALVDFDIIALITASIDARHTVAEFAEYFGDRDPAVSLPLSVAKGMRPNATLSPKANPFG